MTHYRDSFKKVQITMIYDRLKMHHSKKICRVYIPQQITHKFIPFHQDIIRIIIEPSHLVASREFHFHLLVKSVVVIYIWYANVMCVCASNLSFVLPLTDTPIIHNYHIIYYKINLLSLLYNVVQCIFIIKFLMLSFIVKCVTFFRSTYTSMSVVCVCMSDIT